MYICSICKNNNPTDARFCNWCGTMIGGQKTTNQSTTGLLPSQSVLDNGRYAILRRVGQGGMGAVYKAQDLLLNKRVVAIKEMSRHGLAGQELETAITAFTHEAEILSRLKHQSLPHVYETFEENGRHYLVMEFIEGETLDHVLKRLHSQGKCLPVKQVLIIGRQLCTVLSYLHTQHPPVIFRDLKPANIMLDAHGQVYLIDFGIARVFKQGQIKDTMALGSTGYAPPEQYRHATSPRSDIYSLGATLHYMLTGNDPSDAPFQFQPLSLPSHPHLEHLIMSMVALDDALRPASMNEVRKRLDDSAQPQKLATSVVQGKTTGHLSTSPPITDSITIYAVLSSSPLDQKLWISLKDQLMSELHLFPNLVIKEAASIWKNGSNVLREDAGAFMAAVPPLGDEANLVLLLLSEDFLSMPGCLAIANKAIDRFIDGAQGVEILAVLLRPCKLNVSTNPSLRRLAHIRMIPKDAIAHLSVYAQEQSILEVARAIRNHLITRMLADDNDGSMNLLQWLLWQLYGKGHLSCPYFVVGHYALKYIRTSGFGGGVLIHLLDLQDYQTLAEYIVGSLDRRDLTDLVQTIAPSATSLETVQGIALRDDGEGRLLERTVALRDKK